MKVTFRAPLKYSSSAMENYGRQLLVSELPGRIQVNEQGLPLFYYLLGLDSMAFGIYWNVQGGTVDMEIPVVDPALREIYFSKVTPTKSPFAPDSANIGGEPDGISAILADCVEHVTAERIMLYIDAIDD